MTEPIQTAPPRRSWQRTAFLTVSALVVVSVVILAHDVMLPFVLALLIAYVLTPLVARVERAGRPRSVVHAGEKRIPRALAVGVVYVVVLGSIALFVRFTAPRVGQELGGLRRELPRIATSIQHTWVPAVQERLRDVGLMPAPVPATADKPCLGADPAGEPGAEEPCRPAPAIIARPQPDGSIAIDIGSGVAVVPTGRGYVVEPRKETKEEPFDLNRAIEGAVAQTVAYAQHNAMELLRFGRDIVAGVTRVIFIFSITMMLSAYIILTREKLLDFFRSLVRPSRRDSYSILLARIDRGLSGVVRGQLIICLINGGLSAVGFAIIGLKYWPVLALIATVLSLIPIFGSIASAVPAVALGLTQSFGTAVLVLVFIIGIHQLEANVLNPKVMGDSAKIHPVLVIFSLLVGEHFFHTVGALLAVPVMSIAQSVFLHFRAVVHQNDPDFATELSRDSAAPAAR